MSTDVERDASEPEEADAGENEDDAEDEQTPADREHPKVRVIRANEVEDSAVTRLFERPPKLVKRDVLAAIEDVQAELDDASRQAREMVESAREEAEKIRQEARDEGVQKGMEEVMEHLGKARSEYARLQDEAEADMLELAFRVAKRIVGYSVDIDHEIIRNIVAESLEHVRGKRQIVVFVHPDDLPIVAEVKDQLVEVVEGAAVYFDEDPDVDRGGCVIETESGRIDARLDVQLDVLREALTEGG